MNLLYPRKVGILWITHGHRPHPRLCPQRFSCVQPTSHISFGISFKLCMWLTMAEIWPPYYFGSPGITIMLWGVKNVKNFDYCLCSSCRAQFLSYLLCAGREIIICTMCVCASVCLSHSFLENCYSYIFLVNY